MKFSRGFTRSVAVLTTISLLLPTVVFALSAAALATGLSSVSGRVAGAELEPAKTSVVTLQAQDLFGMLNGEIGGIPQFGLTSDMGLDVWTPAPLSASLRGESLGLASRVRAMMQAREDERYAATPLPAEASMTLPNVALVGNDATDILLDANVQASETFKLTSPASLPRLIETPLQSLAASAGALTIKNLLDRKMAAAPSVNEAAIAVGSGGAHRFGSVLTGVKPTVDAAPFGREWATVVFGSFTSELVLRLGSAPEGTMTVATSAWAAIWLELMLGLAGLAALGRAQRGQSARHALLVILNRQQRE